MSNENLPPTPHAAKQSAPSPYRGVHVDRIPGRHPRPLPNGSEGGYRDGICQPDGEFPYHYLPDEPVEHAALRHTLGPSADAPLHRLPLGDLIVRALTGRDLYADYPGHPEVWTTFEATALELIAAELRALAVATSQRFSDDDAPPCTFEEDDRQIMMAGLARRCEAIVELASRFREARWGHPQFGGHDPEETAALAGEGVTR